MGLFDNIFGSKQTQPEPDTTPWIPLEDLEQLETIVAQSKIKTQVIFKHSTRCGISRMVIREFKKDYPFEAAEVDLYYLDLLRYRAISNAIAERFQVAHESPQLLVVKDGVVVGHASHGAINGMALQDFV